MAAFREDPAAYMRAYRARKSGVARPKVGSLTKGQEGKLGPLYSEADLGRPRTAPEKRWDAEIDALDARGRNAKWNGDGYSDSGPIVRTPAKPPALRKEAASPPSPQSMFAIGGTPGKGLVAQGPGMPVPPDMAAVSAYTLAKEFEANATASINLLALEVATLKQRVGELEHERTEAVRNAPESAWQKVLMAAAMGVQAYAAMCQAAEQDRAAHRARRREATE
jgi:hypothetical protein